MAIWWRAIQRAFNLIRLGNGDRNWRRRVMSEHNLGGITVAIDPFKMISVHDWSTRGDDYGGWWGCRRGYLRHSTDR